MDHEFDFPGYDDDAARIVTERRALSDIDYADEYALNDIGLALRVVQEAA
jgi:hypothetical protein